MPTRLTSFTYPTYSKQIFISGVEDCRKISKNVRARISKHLVCRLKFTCALFLGIVESVIYIAAAFLIKCVSLFFFSSTMAKKFYNYAKCAILVSGLSFLGWFAPAYANRFPDDTKYESPFEAPGRIRSIYEILEKKIYERQRSQEEEALKNKISWSQLSWSLWDTQCRTFKERMFSALTSIREASNLPDSRQKKVNISKAQQKIDEIFNEISRLVVPRRECDHRSLPIQTG